MASSRRPSIAARPATSVFRTAPAHRPRRGAVASSASRTLAASRIQIAARAASHRAVGVFIPAGSACTASMPTSYARSRSPRRSSTTDLSRRYHVRVATSSVVSRELIASRRASASARSPRIAASSAALISTPSLKAPVTSIPASVASASSASFHRPRSTENSTPLASAMISSGRLPAFRAASADSNSARMAPMGSSSTRKMPRVRSASATSRWWPDSSAKARTPSFAIVASRRLPMPCKTAARIPRAPVKSSGRSSFSASVNVRSVHTSASSRDLHRPSDLSQ